MGDGVQPIRSFTSFSTATPIRLAINRHDPHLSVYALSMAVTITDKQMISDLTTIRADYRPHDAANGAGRWVSTHPDLCARLLDRNAALMAMMLAEEEAAGRGDSSTTEAWREELHISRPR